MLLGGAHETRRQGRLAETKIGPTLGCRKVSAFVSSSRSCELSFARFSGSDLDAKRNLPGDGIRYMQRTGTLDLICVAKLAHGGEPLGTARSPRDGLTIAKAPSIAVLASHRRGHQTKDIVHASFTASTGGFQPAAEARASRDTTSAGAA